MWEFNQKEGWVPKNWCFWTVVLEKTLESPLDCKEIKSVNSKGNQPWIFIGRTNAEGEAPILWPPDAKNWLIRKDPDAGKDWRQEEKGMKQDEMVGCHHWFSAYEFEQTLGDSEGQESLACYSPWGCKKSDTTEWLNNNGDNPTKPREACMLCVCVCVCDSRLGPNLLCSFKVLWGWGEVEDQREEMIPESWMTTSLNLHVI